MQRTFLGLGSKGKWEGLRNLGELSVEYRLVAYLPELIADSEVTEKTGMSCYWRIRAAFGEVWQYVELKWEQSNNLI